EAEEPFVHVLAADSRSHGGRLAAEQEQGCLWRSRVGGDGTRRRIEVEREDGGCPPEGSELDDLGDALEVAAEARVELASTVAVQVPAEPDPGRPVVDDEGSIPFALS